MGESKERNKRRLHSSVGFVACYNGKEIASADSLSELANRARVKALLGKKGLVIKHNVPEDLVAVY